MNIVLFEDAGYERLLPLTWVRTCCELVCGRDRLIDKIRTHVRGRLVRIDVRAPLTALVAERLPVEAPDAAADWCLLNARALVTGPLTLPAPGVGWRQNGDLVAAGVTAAAAEQLRPGFALDAAALTEWSQGCRYEPPPETIRLIEYPWDLIQANAAELLRQCRPCGAHAGQVDPGAHLVQPEQIYIGAGARVKPGAVLDGERGPVYLDAGVVVQPNAVLEGPCYIGPRSIVWPHASIGGGTSIGPVCKVGGEIKSSVLLGYTNKQHDGYLGHSYVGSWVNVGASTVTSDLKNTYGTIRVSLNGRGVETGRHFLGSIIGDHSKIGIGTILPTGGVIGVASNVFTGRSVPKFVPSFAWLTDDGLDEYRVEKAVNLARVVMARRDVELSDEERDVLVWVAQAARQMEAAGWRPA